MEQVILWSELATVIEPYYPKPEDGRAVAGRHRAYAAQPLSTALVHTVRSHRGGGLL